MLFCFIYQRRRYPAQTALPGRAVHYRRLDKGRPMSYGGGKTDMKPTAETLAVDQRPATAHRTMLGTRAPAISWKNGEPSAARLSDGTPKDRAKMAGSAGD